jgi:2-polyprenyl-3-methyl-5-hydroxy-6-metoxy-1,4-benzoquinol methylase
MKEETDLSWNDTRSGAESDLATATDDYAARFAGEAGRWMLDVQTAAITPWFEAWPPGRILDVGGAHGQMAVSLARAGRDVTVTGSVPDCETWLRQRAGDTPIGFTRASSLSLPFADRAFDQVLSLRMLTHSADWQSLIRELCRVSARFVIVDYPTVNSLNRMSGRLLFVLKRKIEKNTRPYRLFRDAEVEREFRRHGFSVRERKREFFWPMALHRLFNRSWVSKTLNFFSTALGLKRCWGSPVILMAERDVSISSESS